MIGMHIRPTVVFVVLVALGVASRVIQEVVPSIPPNFHAVTAIAMFAGFYFARRWVAAAVPLAAMIFSDFWIGGYEREVMLVVYSSLLLPVLFRSVLRTRMNTARITASALICSVFFYLVTNLAVWHVWYEHTWTELGHCYLVALPFLAYSIAGDLAYCLGLFGAYQLITSRCAQTAMRKQITPQAAGPATAALG